MTIDKFGRHIEYYFHRKFFEKNKHLLPQQSTIVTATTPPTIDLTAAYQYIENKLKSLYGYLIFYINAGPAKDSKTQLLKLSTGGYEYQIHLKECELILLKTSKNLGDIEVYVNGKIIPKNFQGLKLHQGDTITVKEIKPVKTAVRVVLFVKYPIYV